MQISAFQPLCLCCCLARLPFGRYAKKCFKSYKTIVYGLLNYILTICLQL